MKIFKLEPKNLDSHHWNASVYSGFVLVRSKDEKHARIKAAFDGYAFHKLSLFLQKFVELDENTE